MHLERNFSVPISCISHCLSPVLPQNRVQIPKGDEKSFFGRAAYKKEAIKKSPAVWKMTGFLKEYR